MTSAMTTLPPEAASVSEARRFVCDTLVGWDLAAACDAAEMLVSELATNAVLHARTVFTVEVSRQGETVRVCVLDLSPAAARPRHYGTDATTGRGLRLVETLASQWGADPLGDGKVVWFEVPADGAAGGSFDDWAEDIDVDALLAGFDDDAESGANGTQVRATHLPAA